VVTTACKADGMTIGVPREIVLRATRWAWLMFNKMRVSH